MSDLQACQELKIVEGFAGTKSISKEVERQGGKSFTIEINPDQNPSLCKDIREVTREDIPDEYMKPLIAWFSVPCTQFSVASVGTHWKDGVPPEEGVELLMHAFRLINILQPKYWFIENPRGMMRKLTMMQVLPRQTVTYCQYGDNRMKPTDIWTNCYDWIPRPMCSNGDSCHESAPRGSPTGTQGLRGNTERSVIPSQLCKEIVLACIGKERQEVIQE